MREQMVPGEVVAADAASGEKVAMQSELAEAKERYLRLAAEFENFKKRSARESERRAAAQKESFVREVLPAVDNLERALSDGLVVSAEQLREGVELTLRELTLALNRHGFTSREDLGRPFDPNFHHAVSTRAEPSRADHAILEVCQRGWLRGKELFRPAKVVVNDLRNGLAAGGGEASNKEKGQDHV
jgi:molecular chaperone GrpE